MTRQEIGDILDGVATGDVKPLQALRMLSDLGVVIKVKGELPIEVKGDVTLAGAELLAREFKDLLPQLGYTAFESLIKEGE